MAVTITEPSQIYLPSENLSWYEADSTNKNELSFNYTFTVQVAEVDETFGNGVTGSDIAGVFRVPPRPLTGEGYFSPNAIIKNYVVPLLQFNSGSTVTLTNDGLRKFRIVYGEEYVTSGPTGGATAGFGATGETYYTWSSVIQDENFPTYDQRDYIVYVPVGSSEPVTNLLTDSSLTRCSIDNDNLYALIDNSNIPGFGATRDKNDLIGSSRLDYTSGTVLPQYTQEVGTGVASASSWFQEPDGISAGLPGAGIGDYSRILTYSDTTNSMGPVFVGDGIFIEIQTPIAFGDIGNHNGLYLFGKDSSGVWSVITQFSTINVGGNAAMVLGIGSGGYIATSDYSQIGLSTRQISLANIVLEEVETFSILSPSSLYWEKNIVDNPIPVRYPITSSNRLTYINAGKLGIGEAEDEYSIKIVNGAGEAFSKEYTFKQDCPVCGNCDKIQLSWLNSKGGYDSYFFNCLAAKQLDVTRVNGGRALAKGYTVGARGKINPNNIGNRIRSVATNYVTGDQIDWLESLMMSPDVYEVNSETGVLIPVIINNSTYSQFVRQDKLKVASFDYTIGYNLKSQTF